MTLPVPHYQQSTPYSCLPACVRMVLSFYGHEHSEKELIEVFNTILLLGTQPDNVISGLEEMGYHALWFENATLERLHSFLDYGWPAIVLLRAADLPYGIAGLHSVVVIGLVDDEIIFLDPAQSDETTLNVSDFIQAWSKLDHQGIVIWI